MKAISINNLKKTYNDGTIALNDISFDVEQGDFFALLGPNGAGKTTTIGILTSLVNKTSGSVLVSGHDIDTDFAAAKACLGVVPQEFNFSIFETVESIVSYQARFYGLSRKLAKARTEKYLKLLDLWDRRQSVARYLSGGMKRRLMIARALVHEPKILILDEPTAGVDVEVRHSMWDFLQKINQEGLTIILTTHYLEEAENHCRNIAIIDHGEIIEYTQMSTLLQKLDYETLVLYLNERYTELPDIPDVTIFPQDDFTLEIKVPKAFGMNALFNALTEKGIKVNSMRNKINRLEELFITITNREPNL